MSDRFARKVFDIYMDCPGNLGDITCDFAWPQQAPTGPNFIDESTLVTWVL
jgi:hypothetical protein